MFLVREEGKVSLKRWVRRSRVVRANIDDFLKLGCRNTAHRCGTKRVSKSKCTKHTSFGRLLKVRMSKQCTPLWREVRFQVKMHKTHHVRTTFGKMSKHGTCGAKQISKSKCTKHTRPGLFFFFCAGCCVAGPDYFSKLGCRKIARHCGRKCVSKSKCTKHLRFGALLEVSTSHVRSSFSQLVSQSIIVNPSVCQLVTQRLLN